MKRLLPVIVLALAFSCTNRNQQESNADSFPVKYENDLFSISLPKGWEYDDSKWMGQDSLKNEVDFYNPGDDAVWFHIVKASFPLRWKKSMISPIQNGIMPISTSRSALFKTASVRRMPLDDTRGEIDERHDAKQGLTAGSQSAGARAFVLNFGDDSNATGIISVYDSGFTVNGSDICSPLCKWSRYSSKVSSAPVPAAPASRRQAVESSTTSRVTKATTAAQDRTQVESYNQN